MDGHGRHLEGHRECTTWSIWFVTANLSKAYYIRIVYHLICGTTLSWHRKELASLDDAQTSSYFILSIQ